MYNSNIKNVQAIFVRTKENYSKTSGIGYYSGQIICHTRRGDILINIPFTEGYQINYNQIAINKIAEHFQVDIDEVATVISERVLPIFFAREQTTKKECKGFAQ